MGALLYHILAKRKLLLKTIVIIGLLSLIILVFLFPAQLATPHVIRKYFKFNNPITISEDLQDSDLSGPDFMFNGYVKNITFVSDFNQICKESSLKVYDTYKPLSLGCFGIEDVIIANQTTEEWTIFGINTEIYAELVSATNSSFDNVPLLITKQPTPDGLFRFNSSKIGNFNFTIDHNLLYSELQEILPSFNSFLDKQPYRPINKSRMIFIPHESFQTTFKIDDYEFTGYIKFTSYQEDVLYWSLDAPRKINLFKENLYQKLCTKELSVSFAFFQTIWDKTWVAENYVLIVNIIYSFIHALQLIIWGLSGTIIFLTLIKMQQSNKNKEFQMLLAGKKFSTRLLTILSENFLIVASSSAIAYGLLWPFVKLQSLLFNFPFDFYNKNVKLALIVFPVCLFFGLLIIYLDFEFHLRRTLNIGQTESEDYQPFTKIPRYIRYQIILVFIILMWLLNRSLQPFLFQMGVLLVIGVIGGILFLLIKGVIWLVLRITKKTKHKKDKPLTNFALLLNLWKKPINTRFILNGFIGTLIIGLCIYSIVTAEVQKTAMYVANDYCVIKTTVNLPNNNTESIEAFLQNNTLLNEHYTKLVYALHNPSDNISLLHKNQTKAGLANDFCELHGINLTSYQTFYSSWRTENWLQDNIAAEKLNSTNVFASKNFARLGYELGDLITLANNQNLSIAGFIDQWIGIPSGTDNILVFENQVMEKLLLDTNSSLEYRFRFNVEEKDIERSVEYLLNHLSNTNGHFTLSYIPPEMIEGIKIVFLFPIIMTLKSLVLFIITASIYNNLTNIYSSDEARTLGILFMSTDYRKTLFQMKLFEILISTIPIVIIVISIPASLLLMLNNAYNLLGIITPRLGLSENVMLYSTIIVLVYLLILIGQNSFDYLKYRKLQAHLLFRHIE
ncbi:MAG: hypothetical protein ACTSXA_03825 [Candidatus Heimdallarchaeota archaeon]